MKTPCDEDIRQQIADALSYKDGVDPALLRRYQALVGALLYCATNTRPNVAYAVAMLCRAMSCPTEERYASALRECCTTSTATASWVCSTRGMSYLCMGSPTPTGTFAIRLPGVCSPFIARLSLGVV